MRTTSLGRPAWEGHELGVVLVLSEPAPVARFGLGFSLELSLAPKKRPAYAYASWRSAFRRWWPQSWLRFWSRNMWMGHMWQAKDIDCGHRSALELQNKSEA